MSPPTEAQARKAVASFLAEWLGTAELRLEASGHPVGDFSATYNRVTLLLEYKRSSDAATVKGAIEQIGVWAKQAPKKRLPILVVPYMGEVGQRLCREAGIDWMDLSGNASIRGGGLVIHVQGRENRFKRPGRPSSPFAPKAARIARQLLVHSGEPLLQKDLAELSHLDRGYVSKVVGRLEEASLVVRDDAGHIQTKDPNLLLDAWSEDYVFEKHQIVQGHVAARDSDQIMKLIGTTLKGAGVRHAATGLAGAWLLTQFATFRITTFFADHDAVDLLEAKAGLRQEPRGANTWIVIPNDDGVYDGMKAQGGILCAHPVQVYLDLLGHPERAPEAAQELRDRLLTAPRSDA